MASQTRATAEVRIQKLRRGQWVLHTLVILYEALTAHPYPRLPSSTINLGSHAQYPPVDLRYRRTFKRLILSVFVLCVEVLCCYINWL
ncbi:hypothetical protein ARMSODRAFT_212465 [Armillaria solidipes]|uniref:Uncharacterized protein n=1 Tax=Armillaria solidipes TaxID=1076256 RepID=A0A2H3BBJ2_9AGAR|nr:hypothetical protein ARMSODRAFT_212465 [Armillaria solidipes]